MNGYARSLLIDWKRTNCVVNPLSVMNGLYHSDSAMEGKKGKAEISFSLATFSMPVFRAKPNYSAVRLFGRPRRSNQLLWCLAVFAWHFCITLFLLLWILNKSMIKRSHKDNKANEHPYWNQHEKADDDKWQWQHDYWPGDSKGQSKRHLSFDLPEK